MDPTTATLLATPILLRHLAFVPLTLLNGIIAALIAGLLAMLGAIQPVTVIVTIILADLCLDTFFYVLGVFGEHSILPRWGKRLGLTTGRIRILKWRFHAHQNLTLALGKGTELFSVPTMISAGILRIHFVTFLVVNGLVAAVRTLFYFWLGYTFGQAAFALANTVQSVTLIIAACLGMLIIGWLVRRYAWRTIAKR